MPIRPANANPPSRHLNAHQAHNPKRDPLLLLPFRQRLAHHLMRPRLDARRDDHGLGDVGRAGPEAVDDGLLVAGDGAAGLAEAVLARAEVAEGDFAARVGQDLDRERDGAGVGGGGLDVPLGVLRSGGWSVLA